MSKSILGHLIISNEEISDICRAIESIYPIVDETLLVYEDKTPQATIDWLNNRKDIYKLKIFHNPFTTLREQRQFLLERTPEKNWIISLDSDEKFSQATSIALRDCLLYRISDKHYITARTAKMPLVISIPHINLVQDIMHWDGDAVFHNQKIFFFEKGLHFSFDQYFTHITYKKGQVDFKDGTEVYSIMGPKEWCLLHYARFCPERLLWRAKHTNNPKYGNYASNAWQKLPPKIIPLDPSMW